MTTHTLDAPDLRPAALRLTRLHLSMACAALGLALVAASDAMPWLTLFHGLHPIAGFRLGGGDLSGLAVAAVALLLVAGRHGGGRVLKPAAVVLATLVVVGAVSTALSIGSYVRAPGAAAALTAPSAGPGPLTLAAGGVALLIASLITPVSRHPLAAAMRLPLLLGASTFVAAWMHLLLTPEHLGVSTLLGGGFLVSGLAQLSLTVLAVERPSERIWALLVMLNTALVVVWAYAVLVGLPFAGDEHGSSGGFTIGSGEPIDLAAVITKTAELTGIAVALVLMRRTARPGYDVTD